MCDAASLLCFDNIARVARVALVHGRLQVLCRHLTPATATATAATSAAAADSAAATVGWDTNFAGIPHNHRCPSCRLRSSGNEMTYQRVGAYVDPKELVG